MEDGISRRHFEDGTADLIEVVGQTTVVTEVIQSARGALAEGGIGQIKPGLDSGFVVPRTRKRVAEDQSMVVLEESATRREKRPIELPIQSHKPRA
jgi:hypothetical protein